MSKTSNKQTAAANAVLSTFRLVVRGNTLADGKRVRRVKNVQASSPEQAAELGEAMAVEAAEGLDLDSLYFNIYPPVGQLCNGGLSKGYEVVNGFLTKTGKAAVPAPVKAAAPAPVKAAAPAPVKPARVRKPKVKAAPATIVADAAADVQPADAVVDAPANEETTQQAA